MQSNDVSKRVSYILDVLQRGWFFRVNCAASVANLRRPNKTTTTRALDYSTLAQSLASKLETYEGPQEFQNIGFSWIHTSAPKRKPLPPYMQAILALTASFQNIPRRLHTVPLTFGSHNILRDFFLLCECFNLGLVRQKSTF